VEYPNLELCWFVVVTERSITFWPKSQDQPHVCDLGRRTTKHARTSQQSQQPTAETPSAAKGIDKFGVCLTHLKAAVALYFAFYNFCRAHSSLRITPAMEAGLTDHVWSVKELLEP